MKEDCQLEYGLCEYKDVQEITIREAYENTSPGRVAREVIVSCEYDLADSLKLGEKVLVVGVYCCLAPSPSTAYCRTFLEANNVVQMPDVSTHCNIEDVTQCRALAKRNDVVELLCRSIAPSIFCNNSIKKAILCLLVGGVDKTLPDTCPSDDNCREDEECNTVDNLTQCSLSSSNNLNTECSSSSSEFREPQLRKRRRTYIDKNIDRNRICTSERTEEIHQALAKMIAMNQMPLSFCSSSGFKQFMSIVEPNYIICKEGAIKQRLKGLKSSVEYMIKKELKDASNVSCTTDCWSSIAQETYITVTAHFIDDQWCPKSYTLTTHKLDDRHTASNLSNQLEITFNKWDIGQKIMSVVTDNAKNVLNAVNLLDNITEKSDLTCAAHSLQLAVNNALKYDKIENLIQVCSKIVCHFKHSNLASQYLKDKQEQLGLPTESLIQSCKTRWNSIFMMLDRLYKNRCPISNVLADRSMTTAAMAHKFEVTEHQWTDVETLIKLLKPLQIMTTVFCGEKYCSSSMVRPLLNAVIQKHLKHDISDDEISEHFKTTVIRELSDRFKLLWCPSSVVTARQIASFLDPRFKDLEHEPVEAREEIRTRVKNLINEVAEISCDVQIESPVTKHHGALEFLFGDEVNSNTSDSDVQYQNYLAEPQLKFDFDALEWWKTRASKYPLIVELAKKYLGIPATSVSSERCFSTAGNIVTAKRSCLAPETVNMLVFLYQNKQLFITSYIVSDFFVIFCTKLCVTI
ncbi:hypothetical protein QTP88_024114 [Uroleucon formosanum]